MDNFAVQMEENLKVVDELKKQLEQEKNLANEEQQQTYKAHYEKMMLLQQKLRDLYVATQKKAQAMAKEQDNARIEISKAQQAERKAFATRDNTERRYNCAKNKGSSTSEGAADAYAKVKADAETLQDKCCGAVASTCADCGTSWCGGGRGSGSGGSSATSGSRR